MNRRKLRLKYRRYLRYYDFDLKFASPKQTDSILEFLQTAKSPEHLAAKSLEQIT